MCVHIRQSYPLLSSLVKILGSLYAGIIRIGIPSEDIRVAYQLDAIDTIDRLYGNKNGPLIQAVKDNDLQAVQNLLADGADVNARDTDSKGNGTILGLAAYNGYTEIVKLLLETGADLGAKTKKGATALIAAAEKSNVEVIKLLLAHGADVNVRTIDNGTRQL